MEGIVGIIIQLVIGAIGGNATGAAAKNLSLGTPGNSIVGAIGGIVLAQVLAHMGIGAPGGAMPAPDATAGAAPAAGGLDMGALIAQVIGSGAGGAVLTGIVGAIKNSMGK
jgi:hypothetical protein